MSKFVHLHVHTQYSILDGASPVTVLVRRAKELGMPAIAITDHGNMFGVKEFHDKAVKEGIKPILGCEVYVVKNRFEKDKDEKAGDHLILLAKNLEGYRNLTKMVSYSWTEGFYYKPRIDKSLLRRYREGLICCSACLGGELPQSILNGRREDSDRIVEEFKEIFGEDYYLEMQLHYSGRPEIDANVYDNQRKVNGELMKLARKHGVKYIASNDVHFVYEEDAPAHDRLICLNTGRDLDDPKRMRYTSQEFLKSAEQMEALFPDNPQALETTLEIASKVEEYSLEREPLMPAFPVPEDFALDPARLGETFVRNIKDAAAAEEAGRCASPDGFVATHPEYADKLNTAKQFLYLEHLTYEGAKKRYGENIGGDVTERIRFELDTIEWMGFPGYFLIVWDFIRAARDMGVAVGPGRGSAAGSVVAYSLGITSIDPVKYDLLFERFLNPDRISMPDIDIDFDEDGRADVLRYVTEKYGSKRVAQIITFGTMAPKMAIRDVARVQGLPLAESDRLTKLVPDKILPEKGESQFDRAYRESPELAAEKDSPNPLIRDTLEYAEKLEGSVRQTGVHACGVIIGPDDLENFVPLAVAKDADLNVVQYDGKLVESIGLVKMDFLGLKTLSIIKDALDNIESVKGEKIDIDSIPFDDTATYELYGRGDTTGLFQFESPGMKKHLRNLKPNRFEDLIAMNALYRPGPMEYIPNFIARKHGLEKVVYDIPEMEEYLKDTYGITVYQEQVMLLSQKLAGFTGGEADTLRKAMGKKQKSVLDKLKPKFLEGVKKKGYDVALCDKIWHDWEAFASYAFNKSHSTCYAYVSYQTAWLKAHYPSEFMAALLSRNLSDIKKLSFFMDECKRMGIQVLGPDINESIHRFSSDGQGRVRFGLAAVKGVGEAAVKSLVEERRAGGKFTSVFDFAERMGAQVLNKKNMECLAMAGAFDSISGFNRCRFFASADGGEGSTFMEQLIRYGNRIQSEKNNSQQSLFGGTDTVDIQKPEIPSGPEWTKLEMLNREKEVAGIYLSSHPLDEYGVIVKNFCNTNVADLAEPARFRDREFIVAGIVTDVQNLTSKAGKPFGRFTLEDYNGSYQFTLFGKDYENYRKYLYTDYYLMVKGRIVPRQYNDKELEPRITSVMQLSEAEDTLVREMVLTLPLQEVTAETVEDLSAIIRDSKGNIQFRLRVTDAENNVSLGFFSKSHRINLSAELIRFCEEAITKDNLEEILAGEKPVVIDFWAEWCGPCRMIAPIIEELAEQYKDKVVIGKCDIESNDTVAVKYGIRNIPTVIFIKNGVIVDKQVGASQRSTFEAKIDKMLG
ncbi:dna polymerase iii subunit alpha [Holotrichia oblita]|uniref:Dna polymerase iii subunit alpha n=1 Tax=Holotrichia oblita TaxID=644536 RepID=A0ACB9TR52_HOLOL|nr:dna polymerase iii subunit alpha [Holotrichia oblita]